MAFKSLKFTKNWENKTDFPTYEPDEAQVRRDLQCLHDETREFINKTLIPEMEEALSGAGTGGGSGSGGSAAGVMTVIDLTSLVVNSSAASYTKQAVTGDIGMTGDELYDLWLKGPVVVQYKDNASAGTQSALVTAMEKTSGSAYEVLVSTANAKTQTVPAVLFLIVYPDSSSVGGFFVPVAGMQPSWDDIYGKPEQVVQTINGEAPDESGDVPLTWDNLAGKPSGVVQSVNGVGPDENGDVALSGPEIVSGTYVGTGAYGADNPNSLTFDFEPEVVILENNLAAVNGVGFGTTTLLRGVTRVVVCHRVSDSGETDTYKLDVTWDGNTVSWSCYYGDAWQLNEEGVAYHYTAIGTGGSGGTGSASAPTITAISAVLSGTTMTFTETLEDGSTDTIEVTLDDNGVPTGMTVNGTAVGVTMEGF